MITAARRARCEWRLWSASSSSLEVDEVKHSAPYLLTFCALVFACGCKTASAAKRSAKVQSSAVRSTVPAPAASPAASARHLGPPARVTELSIASVDNQMKFDKDTLRVKTGALVHLSFHNNATLSVLSHNWVLVKPQTEAAVALAGLKAGQGAGYVAPGPDVLAHTPLATPKRRDVEVTFTAPAPGTYPYICTVPGHYVLMHGQLIVTS
jgi:azurin